MDDATVVQSETTNEASAPPVQAPEDPKAAHEAAEAARKAEWEAQQAEKKEAAEKAIADLQAMSDEDATAAFVKRTDDQAERLTRRKMKASVTEHIQNMCRSNPDFARLALQSRKRLINCFKYISRQALAYLKESGSTSKGGDVPDDLCYQWAIDYFLGADIEEDKGKDDKFEPKKFYGAESKKAAHELAEAKRYSVWEAKQTRIAETEAAELEKMLALGDDEAIATAIDKLNAGLEPLIRRNMKICVTNHLQSQTDIAFIRSALHPRKNLINCFKYIQRHAMEYLREEAKNNGEDGNMPAGDVPDDLCYEWAVDYYCDPDAEEDNVKDDEFVAKPYYDRSSSSSRTKKKTPPPKPEPPQQVDLDLGWGN